MDEFYKNVIFLTKNANFFVGPPLDMGLIFAEFYDLNATFF